MPKKEIPFEDPNKNERNDEMYDLVLENALEADVDRAASDVDKALEVVVLTTGQAHGLGCHLRLKV